MTDPLALSIVRFRKSSGAVVGAGFLVSEKHIITCAHVVTDALGISRETQKRPDEDVYLDFPLVAPEEKLTARVVFWRPIPPKGSTSIKGKEDIAALEINSTIPEATQPVKLVVEEDLWGHSFRTFGFPSGHDDGLEATGVVRGQQATGWVQIEDVKETGVRLEGGFSGAPVWDEQLNGVVGMAVAADQKRPEAKLAFMIPTKVIATAWSALAERTIPPLILPDKKRSQFWRDRPWVSASLVLVPFLCGTIFIMLHLNPSKVGNQSCFDQARKQKKLVIAIAYFADKDGQPSRYRSLEVRLADLLDRKLYTYAKVCHLYKVVEDHAQAKEIGESRKASAVIWAIKEENQDFLVGITRIQPDGYNTSFPGISATERRDITNHKFKPKSDLELVSMTTKRTLSEMQYSQGNVEDARQNLDSFLQESDSPTLTEEDKKERAKDYYFQGLLFQIPPNANNRQALEAYNTAVKLDPKLYLALLRVAEIHEQLGEIDQAITNYEKLTKLKCSPELKASVWIKLADLYHQKSKDDEAREAFEKAIDKDPFAGHLSRSDARLKWWNDPEGAVEDLEKTLEQEDNNNPDIYESLGLARLQANQLDKAKQAYEKILCSSVNNELRDSMVEELKFIAQDNQDKPELISTINEIIEMLRAAPIPPQQPC